MAGRRTRYRGPVRAEPFHFGGKKVTVVRPAEPDRLLVDPDVLALNQTDDYMPYWAYLWPGAFLLAEAVAAEDWGPDQEALELGCGLGLAGLTGLAHGLRVAFSDYDEAPLRFVAQSAQANGFDPSRFSTRVLDWRDPPDERYAVILGADVLYEHRLVPLIVHVLDRLLVPGGLGLLAGPYRAATGGLAAALEATGLRVASSPATASDERGLEVRGTVHRVWRD